MTSYTEGSATCWADAGERLSNTQITAPIHAVSTDQFSRHGAAANLATGECVSREGRGNVSKGWNRSAKRVSARAGNAGGTTSQTNAKRIARSCRDPTKADCPHTSQIQSEFTQPNSPQPFACSLSMPAPMFLASNHAKRSPPADAQSVAVTSFKMRWMTSPGTPQTAASPPSSYPAQLPCQAPLPIFQRFHTGPPNGLGPLDCCSSLRS